MRAGRSSSAVIVTPRSRFPKRDAEAAEQIPRLVVERAALGATGRPCVVRGRIVPSAGHVPVEREVDLECAGDRLGIDQLELDGQGWRTALAREPDALGELERATGDAAEPAQRRRAFIERDQLMGSGGEVAEVGQAQRSELGRAGVACRGKVVECHERTASVVIVVDEQVFDALVEQHDLIFGGHRRGARFDDALFDADRVAFRVRLGVDGGLGPLPLARRSSGAGSRGRPPAGVASPMPRPGGSQTGPRWRSPRPRPDRWSPGDRPRPVAIR